MKLNYDKLMELHQKKINYYENEIKKFREKYDILLKQAENSEIKPNDSNMDNISYNNINKSKRKSKDKLLTNDLNDFMGYIQGNLLKQNEENKLMMSKIIQDKEKDVINEKELYDNYKNIKQTNEDMTIRINANENKINLLQEKLNELNEYKNIIQTMKRFKCKNCSNIYKFKDFINHTKHCQNNLNKKEINDSKRFNFEPNKLNIKILEGQIRNDELNKHYIEYIIDINYDNKKRYQLRKQFHNFSNLYNNIVTLYGEHIKFPLSFADIFQNMNSDSFSSQNKIQILEKFINEVSHTDVINISKSFLKFIEYDKYLEKIVKLNNNSNNNAFVYNANNISKNKKIKNSGKEKENNNNRYINMFNIDDNKNILEKNKYNDIDEK